MNKTNAQRNIFIAFILNAMFAVFEFIGGLWTGSVSILSDAVHDLSDALSILLSYLLEKRSLKGIDKNYTYGHSRYSALGSLVTIATLIVGSIVMIYKAILRLWNPAEINYNGMIVLSVVGLIVNFCAAIITHRGNNLNQKAVNLHMLEDVLGWAVVLIGSIVMRLTNLSIIDPILSIVVSVFILIRAIINSKSAIKILMEYSPVDFNLVKEEIEKIDGVISVHHLHIWALNTETICATMHIITNANHQEVKKEIRETLIKKFNINHTTIESESKWECCEHKSCNAHSTQVNCSCCNNH